MSRRLFAAFSLVAVLAMASPVSAAPQRNSGSGFFDRIVQQIKKVVLDLAEITPPKP